MARNGTTGQHLYIDILYELHNGTPTSYYLFANGQREVMRVSGMLSWLLTDHLGGTAVTVSGTVEVGEVRYRAFGATRFTSGPPPTALQSGRNHVQSSRTLTT